MKVAVVIDTWFPAIGGGQINAWEISKRIAQKGQEVDIITRNNGNYNQDTIKNLRIIQLGPKSNSDSNLSRIIFLIKTFFYIQNKDYDIIHLQAFLPGLLSPAIRYLLKNPTVFTIHGTRMFENSPKPSFGFWLEKIILTKIKYDAQISVTKAFLKFKNVNKNISYIPNGIDPQRFNKVKIQKAKYPKILWVGRLDPVKRVEDLLYAMQILKKEVPDAKLTVVGYGRDEKKLKKIKKILKLTNVKFAGKKEGPDLIKEYKSAHLFVLPSTSEGQPLSILEALACNLPIVATKVGGITEIVKSNVDGILVLPHEPNKLAKAISRVLKKENSFGSNRFNILKQHNWGNVATTTLEAYTQLL